MFCRDSTSVFECSIKQGRDLDERGSVAGRRGLNRAGPGRTQPTNDLWLCRWASLATGFTPTRSSILVYLGTFYQHAVVPVRPISSGQRRSAVALQPLTASSNISPLPTYPKVVDQAGINLKYR